MNGLSQIETSDMQQLSEQYRTGSTDPVARLDQELEQIARVNPMINAIVFVAEDSARAAAQASAARWSAGRPKGPLDGVPVTIKDSVRAAGMPWRHGTAPNSSLAVDTEDSPPARALKNAGAVIVGKTAMPDLGMMAAGVSSLYGVTRNPWDLDTNTSGSSAGAGASLAAGIGFASVGSDIAGSVRLPAASNGLVGLKPTQGLIPHLASSTTRSAGPLARTVSDARAMLEVITAADRRDNLSLPPLADAHLREELSPAGLRFGILSDLGYGFTAESAVKETLQAAAQALSDGGADVVEMAPLFDHDPYDALDRVFQVRALTEIESYGSAGDLVLKEVRDWALAARSYSSSDFSRDLAAVDVAQQHVAARTAEYDFVVSPVLPVVSFPAESVGLDASRPLAHCGFTAWYNQSGQPAVTLCFGMHQGHPIGVQLIGQRFDDYKLMRLAEWLEARRSFPLQFPSLGR